MKPRGDRGCLSIFGSEEREHELFVDHVLAEYPVKTEGRGRVVTAWELRPGRDNHWLDAPAGSIDDLADLDFF